jgi:hypothetical protein
MARKVPSCCPDLRAAGSYETYTRYSQATRDRLEHNEEFSQVWLERLFRIAEKEGKHAGLRMDDSMASWDSWYNNLVVPLKGVFWLAWEQTWQLPLHYERGRAAAHDAMQEPPVLRCAAMAAAAASPAPNLSELAQQRSMTSRPSDAAMA